MSPDIWLERPDLAQRARIGTRAHSRVRDLSSSSRQHLSLLLGLQRIAAVLRVGAGDHRKNQRPS